MKEKENLTTTEEALSVTPIKRTRKSKNTVTFNVTGHSSIEGRSFNINIKKDNLYKEIAQVLLNVDAAGDITFTSPLGKKVFNISYSKGAKKIAEIETANTFFVPIIEDYSSRFLTNVSSLKNEYKFYKLEIIADKLKVTYGNLGVDKRALRGTKEISYPKEMYWIKFFERISHGYKDQTETHMANEYFKFTKNEEKDEEKERTPFNASEMLSSVLFKTASLYIEEVFADTKFTVAMFVEAKRKLEILKESTDISSFNKNLLDLLSVCPRKVASIKCLMARSENSFEDIIDREEGLVSSMDAIISGKEIKSTSAKNHQADIFKTKDIIIDFADDKEKQIVMNMVNSSLKEKVVTVYKVTSPYQEKKFDQYLKTKNISEVKNFWHGSRTENWYSIITNSLQLNPKAVKTGSAFGKGIYFAPSCMKSYGYTSGSGSRWVGGSSSTAFIGVYKTAYGDPYFVSNCGNYDEKLLISKDKHCVHARAGNGSYLQNDEVIFFNESAVCIQYLVEFSI